MSKKNYYKLFCDYCVENELSFYIFSNGCVGFIGVCSKCSPITPVKNFRVGTKAAYVWLVREHKKLKGGE